MEPTEPSVLVRTPSGTWLPILVWAMAAWMAVDAVWRAGLAGLRYWPVLALIAWAAYLLLWAPRVLVGSDGVRVVNLLRDYRLPYSAITDIETGWTVRIDYRDADQVRRVYCWNAPPVRPQRRPTAAGGVRPVSGLHDGITELRRRWTDTPLGEAPAEVRWRWPHWLVLAALVVAAAF